MSNGITINRRHDNMELLILRWSIESHIFVVAWGEFRPTLEDVVALTVLPVFKELKTIKLPQDYEEVSLDEGAKRNWKH